MIIEPKVNGFLCATAHPAGCREHVRREIEYMRSRGKKEFRQAPPKSVLVIGCSAGYGLSARIAAAYGYGAATLGICREREPSESRTASPGYYNYHAFDELAGQDGLWAKTLNEDAFRRSTKEKAARILREEMGPAELVIYSLAAPKRTMPDGSVVRSALKTTGEHFVGRDLDLNTMEVREVTIDAATPREIEDSVKVMGGEDWYEWIRILSEAGALAEKAVTVAFSYLGPEITYPIYLHGTMGQAKKHLYETSRKITENFRDRSVQGYISMNKSMVTQASIAIPRAPIYIAIAKKVMEEEGCYEDCIRQMDRLLCQKMAPGEPPEVDEENRIRMDDLELQPHIQEKITERMETVTTESVEELAGLAGYREDFYHMYGFGYGNVDYEADISHFI
ncbi:MAG: trans-2-enoyl-CoA reductase family protein [Firmicutes bacterium]|nr:trans-2-enoyl-CoA reductase family protein [Bacillota bacterium]